MINMKLISPTLDYADQFLLAIEALRAEDTHGFWDYWMDPTNLAGYFKMTSEHAQGLGLKDDGVPSSTFWLIDKGKWVGHCNVRHGLNPRLTERGGHIGYAIHPRERGKGYGQKILELALIKARKIGLNRVLITCNEQNEASRKIIERNNGILEDRREIDGKIIRRYWIELG